MERLCIKVVVRASLLAEGAPPSNVSRVPRQRGHATGGTRATPTGVIWTSEPGTSYRLDKSSDLTQGFFPLIEDLSSTPPTNVYYDVADPGSGAVFYRIVVP